MSLAQTIASHGPPLGGVVKSPQHITCRKHGCVWLYPVSQIAGAVSLLLCFVYQGGKGCPGLSNTIFCAGGNLHCVLPNMATGSHTQFGARGMWVV